MLERLSGVYCGRSLMDLVFLEEFRREGD